MFTDIQQFL